MLQNTFIGRVPEREILQQALQSREAEMVAVIGRRRVGKTFMIKQVYEQQMVFATSGELGAPLAEQLGKWAFALKEYSGSQLPIQTPANWQEAFILLIEYLKTKTGAEKKVVFFDELSGLSANDSGFLRGLSFFWNDWAVNQNLVVVICGSAASWMIQNVVNDTGGLHNRITRRIALQPFTLGETKKYLESRGCHFSNTEITDLYLALGGIPHYLKEVQAAKSAVQNIDQICFSATGFLRDEFSKLYFALFEHAEKHIAIIRALAGSKQGLTRPEIIRLAKVPENGGATKVLAELEQSGFITAYPPYGKVKKDMLYRLTDEYSLFYLQFIEGKSHDGAGTWHHYSQTQNYKTWSGYAFESVCLKHAAQIKKALGIAGVYAVSASFYQKGTDNLPGAQIDLLLDRNDKVISLIEAKYASAQLTLTRDQADNLRAKKQVFARVTETKKRLMLVMVCPFGLVHNQYSSGLVEAVITLDDLFVE